MFYLMDLLPVLLKQICDEVRKSNSGFTLMFDETTNAKVEMDILIRYWSEKGEVQTKYLTSFMLGKATAEVITDFLLSLVNDKDINLPWEKSFNISSDGPNINKKTWRLFLDCYHFSHVTCMLHTMTFTREFWCMVTIVSSLLLIGSSSLHASRRIFGHSQRIPILMMRPFSLDMSTPDG